MPAQLIDESIPAAGLLPHVMVAKFADHLPLFQQEKIFGRAGHPVLYPRISDIGFNAVVVPVGERLKVVLRGANNDQVYTVPERILQRVRETSGRSELELNLIKGEPRWIVNGCMPDED